MYCLLKEYKLIKHRSYRFEPYCESIDLKIMKNGVIHIDYQHLSFHLVVQ